MPAAPPDCRIYLVVDVGPAGPAPRELARRLQHADVASVLLQVTGPGGVAATHLGELVKAVQSQEVAALIADDARLARQLSADGVHLGPADDEIAVGAYAAAREALGKSAIVGVSAGHSRHRAMVLGELGADYIAFGEAGGPDAVAERLELVAWWAELFEPPCVAWNVRGKDEAVPLVAAGADFIAAHLAALDELDATLAWIEGAIAATDAVP